MVGANENHERTKGHNHFWHHYVVPTWAYLVSVGGVVCHAENSYSRHTLSLQVPPGWHVNKDTLPTWNRGGGGNVSVMQRSIVSIPPASFLCVSSLPSFSCPCSPVQQQCWLCGDTKLAKHANEFGQNSFTSDEMLVSAESEVTPALLPNLFSVRELWFPADVQVSTEHVYLNNIFQTKAKVLVLTCDIKQEQRSCFYSYVVLMNESSTS